MVLHSINGRFAVREGDWKLLLAPGSGGWSGPTDKAARESGAPESQLYHLGRDLGEGANLMGEEAAMAESLLELLRGLVENGRSTPGPPRRNDAAVEIRRAD